jgi:hypothetical protein
MEGFPRSLVGLWPVVLGAVVIGCLLGEFNDGTSFTSGFAQVVVEYLIR